MSSILARGWRATPLLLAIVAISAEFLVKHHAGRGMTTMARATASSLDQAELRRIASWHAHQSGLWSIVGLGLITLAVGTWLWSCRRGEAGTRRVLFALCCLYGSLLMLMV